MPESLLLFGGSFNPIHNGHLIVARDVAERLAVPRVTLVPCRQPPHKPQAQLATGEDRLAMCQLATAGDPLFDVCDWELRQPGPNYTLLTIAHFRRERPDARLYWLIGGDSLAELDTWHRVAELTAMCTLVTAARPGHCSPDLSRLARLIAPERLAELRENIVATRMVDISASEIRERVRAGRCIRYLAPEPVREYIASHGVYGAPARETRPQD